MHIHTLLAACFLTRTLALPLALSKTDPADLPAFYQPISISKDTTQLSQSVRRGAPMSTTEATSFANNLMMTEMNLTQDQFQNTNSYTSNGMTHVYSVQMYANLPIANAVCSTHIDASGSLLGMHNSFVPKEIMDKASPISKRDMMSADQAVLMFAKEMGFGTSDKLQVSTTADGATTVTGASFAMQPIKASQKYYQTGDALVHTWDLSVQMEDTWQNVFVESTTGKVVGMSNWTSDHQKRQAATVPNAAARTGGRGQRPATGGRGTTNPGSPAQVPTGAPAAGPVAPATYNIIPIGKLSPTAGAGNGFKLVTSPWDLNASPNGWHNANKDLSGNNVIAQSNPRNAQSPAQQAKLPRPTNANLNFNFQFNPAQGPTAPANRDAATTNAFYVVNSMHDILYNYGFTEVAGNFQTSNNGKGGRANDAVIANTQDGSGVNNANFASPPDGQNGIMRMYVFNTVNPNRDGALENDVVAHEMVHGLSNRLTGGPANANCLQTLESGGMGEGWSDMLALMVSLPDANTAATPVITGAYVTGNARGIRNFPNSTSTTTNPLMFSSLNKLNEVHNIGEVWCNMLFEVMWNMIATSGKTPSAQLVSSAAKNTGNSDLMLLLVAGMKMQPCNPTFIQARNAIIAADKAMFNGKYSCNIWNAFAKRGMGVNAASTGNPGAGRFTNNNALPAGCAKTF
ncbi:Fungalysin/Thermolysin Extracellular metalloproteinase 5 [Chytriomyces hyalinus]|nr:Fungalysin/Thermolysin Extracellular metalloproteinase 5 [Chytriomyces hyalinus]